jgi:hypothetical protein
VLGVQRQSVDQQEHEAARDQRHADDPGVEKHILDEAMRESADDCRGQEGDEHADDEATRGRIVRQGFGDRPKPVEVHRQDRQNRSELNQDLEGLAGRLEAEEMADEEQVAGRGHRQEFGQALDEAQEKRLDDLRHR